MDENVFTIIDRVYETVETPESWSTTLEQISRLVGASTSMIAMPTPTQRHEPVYVTHNLSTEAIEAYESTYYQHDLFRHRAFERELFQVGNTFPGEALASHQELRQSTFYNEYLRPLMGVDGYLGTVLSDEKADHLMPSLFASFFRPAGAEPFGSDEVRTLQQLGPHIRRAVLLQQTLASLGKRQEDLSKAFDAFSQIIILLDASGQLLHANRQGQQQLDAWQRRHRARRWPVEVGKVVQSALDGQVSAERLPEENGAWLAIAYPLGEHSAAVLDCRPATLMLMIVDTRRPPTELHAALASAYGLTTAETRLLPLLAQALSPAEMAMTLRVDISTIRTQLSAIYAKTGTRRQQDVMTLLGRLPALQKKPH